MRLYIVCFALGVWWLQVQSQLPTLTWYFLLAPLALACLLVLQPASAKWRLLHSVAGSTLCALCGFLWAAMLAGQRLSDELPGPWEGVDVQIVGVVANLPQPYERSLRFEFDVERVLTPHAVIPAHIVLSWWGSQARDGRQATFPQLRAGERWQLTVRLRQPHGTLNPHGFDYEALLLERNIRATGYVRPGSGNRRISSFVARPQYLVERVREFARDRIQNALADAPYTGVLIALAIGEQRGIPPAQWQVFTRTGVNHLISISGLHVTMISGIAFGLIYFLWRRSARLTLRLPARKAAVVAGFVAALIYAWLAGFAVPAQRTVYMLAVVALALWSGRIASSSLVLSAALLLVLLIDPWAVLSAGFWLSFGAMALIMLVSSGRIAQPHWLIGWARVQWAVTLGLVPPLLALFQQVSLISPLANAIAIPVVSLIVVPLTLAGLVLPFDLVLQCAHAVMAACGYALEWMSMLPAAVWQQHAPPAWAVAVATVGVIWMLLPRGFPARWIGVAGFLPLFLVLPAAPEHGDLRLTVLDVGQGLAVVAQTRNHALLYDTGPAFGPQVDSGNRIIVPYLRASGVTSLSGLVVSHADSDHSGGALSVLQAVPVSWLSSSMPDTHPISTQASVQSRCVAGQRWQWDGVDFEVLHPSVESYARDKVRTNDRGCVIRIGTAHAAVLLTADIENKSERELLDTAADKLHAQVMLVPHHGSRTSSSAEFLAQVNPDIALVAAGYRNRFGHPKDEVLDRYRALGSRIFRTDHDGALIVSVGAGGEVGVQRYRGLYRRYWHAPPANPDLLDDEVP